MTTNKTIDKKLLDLQKEFDMNEYGNVAENGFYLVGRVKALITEARANERQAMLDIPELQDETENVFSHTNPLWVVREQYMINRNELRAEIRAAIKKMGGEL